MVSEPGHESKWPQQVLVYSRFQGWGIGMRWGQSGKLSRSYLHLNDRDLPDFLEIPLKECNFGYVAWLKVFPL